MQQRLIALGYLKGDADGIYGTGTAEAVYAFQKNNGLVRDGVAGSSTLSLLYASAAVSATPAPTATPAVTAAPSVTTTTLRKGSSGVAVRELQQRLISLGYLSGKADGQFGVQTYRALVSFQRSNGLDADGIAGKLTMTVINSSSAVGTGSTVTPVIPTVTTAPSVIGSSGYRPTAAQVKYANWYTDIRSLAKQYQYATVYDFTTGASWQVHMFSFGKHAEAEPLTAADTAAMEACFGGNTWNPKAVWVIFGNGEVYMASTHSVPHQVQHIVDNNFPGHTCIHFPRTMAQVVAIGSYATSHQETIDEGWALTQSMIK